MIRFVGVLLTFTFVSLPLGPADAWSGDGHKVACAIAWDELTPTARGGVKIILGVDTKEQFVEDCTWADAYALDNPETASWHFVPILRRRGTINIERDCPEPDSCAIIKIENNIGLVRDGPADLDKSKPLKFLIHLVADLHQPLHIAYKDDDFGAEISAVFLGTRTNLHAVWDTEILSKHGLPWKVLGLQLQSEITEAQREGWNDSTPLDWAKESLKLSRSNSMGYARFSSVVLGNSYFRGSVDDALKRLTQAGVFALDAS